MIRLSVFEPDGTTAVGTVTNVLTASYGAEVNSIGSWTATIPADSPQAAYFSDRYRVQIDVGGEGYVFQGIVTKRVTKVDGETKVLEVSGWSTGRELVDRDTGQGFELESETLTDAFDAILAVEGNWATGTVGSPSLAVWSRRFDGVKLWQGLVKLADMFGVLFREDSRTRTIDAGAFGDDSGLTFRNWEGPVPQEAIPGTVLLSAIESAVESQDIVTRVEPRGQRQGITGDDFTLEEATDTTLYTTQSGTRNGLDYYYLVDSTAESTYGQIEATIRVSDVLPLGLDPSTDLVRAANALHGVAATWLSRRKDPLRSYTFRAEGLRHVVSATDTFKVGQKARVKWSGATNDGVWIDLDEDLWIMGYRRTITADGRSAWQFKTSNIPREVPDSTTKLQEMYAEFEASLTAPWPMMTWGGSPPGGRLTPLGGQLVSLSGFLEAEPTRKWQWTTPDFQTVYSEVYGARDETFDTNYVISKTYKDVDAYAVTGIAEEDDSAWDVAQWIAQSDGGDPSKWSVRLDATELIALIREDANNYSLWVRKGGTLAEVGGGMKTKDAGHDVLIRPSASSSAWTHVSHPRFRHQGALPATTYSDASGTTHNVTMPSGYQTGDRVLTVVCTNAASITTPSGWTLIDQSSTGAVRVAAYYRDTTPGASTVNFATGASSPVHAYSYLIRAGTYTGAPAVSFSNSTSSGAINPPSRAQPSGTYTSTRYICGGAWVDSSSLGNPPTGFSESQTLSNGSSLTSVVATGASGESSVDPSSFSGTPTGSVARVEFTLGVAGFAIGSDESYVVGVNGSATGILQFGTGTSGNQVPRSRVSINLANNAVELGVPLTIPANAPLWVRGSGDVTVTVISSADTE